MLCRWKGGQGQIHRKYVRLYSENNGKSQTGQIVVREGGMT